MDPPPLSPSSTTNGITVTAPTVAGSATKFRLMCSYGGHIVPRPQSNCLFYAGGESRIITLDRRTTASSFSALTAHLSRVLLNQRPFHLKYQLPGEDLDSLVSVINDEDFQNMLEENDRIKSVNSTTTPSRIRLFLFSIKPERIGSMLVDRKSESWFSDALNNTGIIHCAQPTDKDLDRELDRSDSNVALQAQMDNSKNVADNAVAENGIEAKPVIARSESLVLKPSLSFGSTNSLVSPANLPANGVQQPEGNSGGMLERKIRVPSSTSIAGSDNGTVGSLNVASKREIHPEQLTRVHSFNSEMENPHTDPPCPKLLQKAVQYAEYQLLPQSEGKHLQFEQQLPYIPVPGGLPYANQYPTSQVSLAPYYPVYPLPAQNQAHSPYYVNQPYPVYYMPVRQNSNGNMSIDHGSLSDSVEANSRPPLHPHNGVDHQTPKAAYNEVMISQQHMSESAVKANHPLSTMAPYVLAPLPQVKQQFAEHPDLPHAS